MTRNIILAGAILLLALLFLYPFAHAQEHHHPTETIYGATAKFYETWRMPSNRSMSCCSKQDCYATEAHIARGKWVARQRENGKWMEVPAERVEFDRDSPDGQNHVYCLRHAAGIRLLLHRAGAGR
jgi:hypothetical protein